MRYSETLELFEEQFEFPAEQGTVVGELGEIELRTPAGDTVTVGEVLQRTNDLAYDSPGELHRTLIGNLEDGFIGRKFYDDRAGRQPEPDERGADEMSL
jgi:hypothetical protein